MTINWKGPLLALENAMSGLAAIAGTSNGSGYTALPNVAIGPPASPVTVPVT